MLTGPAASHIIVAAVSLAAIVLLILFLARASRLLPALRLPSETGALALRGSLALDARRRLHLVETGGRQVLILTSGAADTMISLPPAAP